MIAQLKDHYLVCGFGRVGRNAACELQRARVPFIILDKNDQRVDRAMRAGMLAVCLDATHDESLREVGVPRARGLISALPSDAENLFVILSAKTLNPRLTVVTRASEEEAGEKLRRAGADTVFAPYTMAGQRLAQALVRPHVVEFLDFTTGYAGPRIMIEQVRVQAADSIPVRSLGDIQARRDLGVIVLAIRKASGEMIFNPPAETAITGGDYLIVVGEQPKLLGLEAILTRT